MKKLVLTLAGAALLAGFGAAQANGPKALTSATMDGITAGGNYCEHSRDSRRGGEHTYQRNTSFLSPQVNVNEQTNVSPNVSVVSIGQNDQETNNHQSSSQSNFNGNISR